jgi:hypothetical protein
MDWLYEKIPRERYAMLQAHLACCPQCDSKVTTWRGAMGNLDGWHVIAPSHRLRPAPGWWSGGWKWAAAAVLLAGGFLAGRANSSASSAEVTAAVEKEVASQMQSTRAELATNLKETLNTHFESIAHSNRAEVERLFDALAATISEGRASDQRNLLAAIEELDARWLGIYASFRRELETVAILTESGFKDTQQQLVQMADFNETPR